VFWIVPLVASITLFVIVHRWATHTFPALARRPRAAAAALAVLFVAQTVTRWTFVLRHMGDGVTGVLAVLQTTLLLAALPIGALHAIGYLAERASRKQPAGSTSKRADPSEDEARERTALTRRQAVEGAGGIALIGAAGSMLGWGMLRGRHAFELVELPVRMAALPRVLDGYVIVQISDLHAGAYVGERELDEGLARVREARPDLVVVTGDLVDVDPRFAPILARKLAELAPRDGVFAALGNHDYYTGPDAVVSSLRAVGVTPLVDDGRVVRAGDGGGFALLGVDDLWSIRHGRLGPRLDRALATVPEGLPRVLLSHQPPTIDRWAGKVGLQLSGHTHGGQINPGFRPADLFLPYVAGEYRVGGSVLYVNRGFGTVGPPARVGAPPEVTRIVLVAA
jgi:predicted MPP superfamily phosphohydrolase